MRKRIYILGIALGLIVPYIGIFAGLQVSVTLGNILAFPIITVAYVTGTPFGMWHPALWLLAAVLSIVVWTVIVAIVDRLLKK